jgi:hypothetical protein
MYCVLLHSCVKMVHVTKLQLYVQWQLIITKIFYWYVLSGNNDAIKLWVGNDFMIAHAL